MLGGTGSVKVTAWLSVCGYGEGDAGMREVGGAFLAIRNVATFLSELR